MIECIVAQFIIAYQLKTQEVYQLYRCEGSKEFKYLTRDKKFEGYYDIGSGYMIITNERKGI